MDKKVSISLKALIVGGLLILFCLWVGLEILKINYGIENAKVLYQTQQNAQNIQALDRAVGELAKQIEELKKAK
jgi:hypothetical protein